MSSMMCGMLLGAGVVSKKTYVDDVFSTYLYRGNSTAGRAINNGIDLSGEGGMTWIKARTADSHALFDTSRGVTKGISSDTNGAESTDTDSLTSFNSNGFSLGTGYTNFATNLNNFNYSSWSFRKAPGFFDVVTYTGNGSNRTISHSLGSVPGMIIIKRTDTSSNWAVYHRGFNGGVNPEQYVAFLDTTDAEASHAASWNNSPPTSSVFHVGTHARVNGNGGTFVAYLFAGDNSDSVHFDGSGDTIQSGTGNAFTHGTSDFTIECWAKFEDASSNRGVYQHNALITQNFGTTPAVAHDGNNWVVYGNGGTNYYTGGGVRTANKWYHLAHVRHSGTTKLYVDGVEKVSFTDTFSYGTTRILIGGYYNTTYLMKGNITNWRLVKGRALYTSNFTPPTSPLGKTYDGDGNMDTFFLCCNTGDPAGYTIDDTGNGMSVYGGDPQQSADVPSTFKASFSVFGENEDQNVIKCGSYKGNGSATHRKIELGFEPQWVMVKRSNNTSSWTIADMMRGSPADDGDSNQNGPFVWANLTSAEATDRPITTHSTGFGIKNTSSSINGDGDTYVYIAIRRPDGYVGKPPELGTDVFTTVTGNSSSTIPAFTSGFPVDFGLVRQPASATNWWTHSRLIAKSYLETNSTYSWRVQGSATFDSNVGYGAHSSWDSYHQGWMWKRHTGFDCLVYEGDGVSGRQCIHSMNKVPEMMWVKAIYGANSHQRDWRVFHKGLNGGSNPEQYGIKLNSTDAESQNSGYWNDTAPTSTNFTVGNSNNVNDSGLMYIAMLFASVDGISSVGSYSGSSSTVTVTTGFQPRFLIIKSTSSASNYNWYTWDTVRGWGSGNDYHISLNKSQAQSSSGLDMGGPTSTGFTVNPIGGFNSSGQTFLYYAHA